MHEFMLDTLAGVHLLVAHVSQPNAVGVAIDKLFSPFSSLPFDTLGCHQLSVLLPATCYKQAWEKIPPPSSRI